MSKKIIIGLCLLVLARSVHAQSGSRDSVLSVAVSQTANAMATAYKEANYKQYVSYLHPAFLQALGGETKAIERFTTFNQQMKAKGATVGAITFDAPTPILTVNKELQCTVMQHSEIQSAKGTAVTHILMIAISNDNGAHWKILPTHGLDNAIVHKMLPTLSSKIVVPAKEAPTVVQ